MATTGCAAQVQEERPHVVRCDSMITWKGLLSLLSRHWFLPTPVFLPAESQGQEAWLAAVYGVTQSWTRLKQRSSRGSIRSNNER